MPTPFNGLSTTLSFQKETTLAGSSSETVYSVPGKVGLQLKPVLGQTTEAVSMWRQPAGDSFGIRHYEGSLDLEFGLNLLTKLFLDSFLEAVSTTALGGGVNQYIYRPRRIQAFGSFKLGLDFSGLHRILHGVVIDGLTLDIRLRATIRLRIDFKCVRKEDTGSNPALGSATSVSTRAMSHIETQTTINSVVNGGLLQTTLRINDEKTPERFDENALCSRFSAARQDFGGELQEYFSTSAAIAELVANQTNQPLRVTITDSLNTSRKLVFNFPGVVFSSGAPDQIGAGDLTYRGTFSGRQPSAIDISNETSVTLVL